MNDHQPHELSKKPLKLTAFYAAYFGRMNKLQALILNSFFEISSVPRAIIEAFIRRSQGERYFSIETNFFTTLLLFFGPKWFGSAFGHHPRLTELIPVMWGWYLFVAAFAVMSFIRWREVKREPSVFELKKFSMSSGYWLPIFDRIKPFGKHLTPRQITIYAEPLPVIVIGLLLFWMEQYAVGILLIFLGVVYSLSYMGAYRHGDNFVMDKLDAIICNDNLYDTFVNRKKPSETNGFNPTMSGPNLFEIRDKLYNSFLDDDTDEAAGVS